MVNFAHRKYLEFQRGLLSGAVEYRLPLGLYRQIVVVVEADSEGEAIDRALNSLGWPDHELELVPMSVISQSALAEQMRNSLPDWFWKTDEAPRKDLRT